MGNQPAHCVGCATTRESYLAAVYEAPDRIPGVVNPYQIFKSQFEDDYGKVEWVSKKDMKTRIAVWTGVTPTGMGHIRALFEEYDVDPGTFFCNNDDFFVSCTASNVDELITKYDESKGDGAFKNSIARQPFLNKTTRLVQYFM